MGNVISPGKGTSDMVQTDPADILHNAETAMMSAAAPTSADVHAGMTAALMTAKQSSGAGPAPAHRMAKGMLRLPNADLCHLCPCCIQHP